MLLPGFFPSRLGYFPSLRKQPVTRDLVSGASRDRTGDLLLAKQALSQLSYGPWALEFKRLGSGGADGERYAAGAEVADSAAGHSYDVLAAGATEEACGERGANPGGADHGGCPATVRNFD